MKSGLSLAIITLLMVVALAVPGMAATTDPNTFVFVTLGDVDTFDPAYCYDTASGEVIHQVYDNLIQYDNGDLGKFLPMLATKVPSLENGLISPDGLTYTFPIRKNVKFHNGETLTPADVEYTFERAMLADPAGGPNWMLFEPLLGVLTLRDVVGMCGGDSDFESIADVPADILQKVYDTVTKTVEVQGDNVVFHLVNPYPAFMSILAKGASWGSIINKSFTIANGGWDGKPDSWTKWYDQAKESMALYNKECGTGPFVLQAWDQSGGQVIFKRFDDYWQGPAKLQTVFIKYVDEAATRLLMLQTGEADAATIQRNNLDQAKALPGVVVVDNLPQVTNTSLLFNYTIPVEGNEAIVGSGKLDGNGIPSDFFNDVHVRRAFNYAFYYDAYRIEVNQGSGYIPKGVCPQVLPYVNKEEDWYTFNLKKAADEFKQAFGGELWNKGFKVTILYNTGNDLRKTAAEILEDGIEQINPKFKVDVQPMQWSTYLDNLRAGRLPVFFMGWNMDFPDAHNFYVPYMSSQGAFAGYCGQGLIDLAKDKFDGLIKQGITASDPAKRQEIYYELQKLSKDYAVCMPYIEDVAHREMRDWVKGFTYCAANSANYDFYTLWKEVK